MHPKGYKDDNYIQPYDEYLLEKLDLIYKIAKKRFKVLKKMGRNNKVIEKLADIIYSDNPHDVNIEDRYNVFMSMNHELVNEEDECDVKILNILKEIHQSLRPEEEDEK